MKKFALFAPFFLLGDAAFFFLKFGPYTPRSITKCLDFWHFERV